MLWALVNSLFLQENLPPSCMIQPPTISPPKMSTTFEKCANAPKGKCQMCPKWSLHIKKTAFVGSSSATKAPVSWKSVWLRCINHKQKTKKALFIVLSKPETRLIGTKLSESCLEDQKRSNKGIACWILTPWLYWWRELVVVSIIIFSPIVIDDLNLHQ